MRTFYDLCPECNSELTHTYGSVLDTYPAYCPVKCTACEYVGHSPLMNEAIAAGWPFIKDEKKEIEK